MVLSSQTPRAGMSRMYMSSRRKSGAKWGWLFLIGVALVSLWMFGVFSGGDSGAGTEQGIAPASANADPGTSGGMAIDPAGTDTRRPQSVNELPPASSNPTQASEPVTLTIGVGETRNATTTTSQPPRQSVASSNTSDQSNRSTTRTSSNAGTELNRGMNLIREGRLVQGRRVLSQLLTADSGSLSALDAQTVRDTLASVNKQLVFSDEVLPGDPLAESYVVQRGDYLSRIAPKYGVPYQFIELINNTPAERLQAGKAIKLINGPFNLRISKRDFRMDVYVNDKDGTPLYIRSFTVGLGEADSTPMGSFVIAPGSKVENPSWRNPRTGEFFGRDDPKNPIGEYWLALKGTDPQSESLSGYGIHGTVDPDSIGREASMGCVRMSDKDIKLIYNMLEPGKSTVQITW